MTSDQQVGLCEVETKFSGSMMSYQCLFCLRVLAFLPLPVYKTASKVNICGRKI
jgi:hypothetical protein